MAFLEDRAVRAAVALAVGVAVLAPACGSSTKPAPTTAGPSAGEESPALAAGAEGAADAAGPEAGVDPAASEPSAEPAAAATTDGAAPPGTASAPPSSGTGPATSGKAAGGAGSAGSGGAPAADPAPAAAPLRSSEDLAAFLVPKAEKAFAARNYELAASLWLGIIAMRGEGDDAHLRLVETYEVAGDFETAKAELRRYLAAVKDPAKASAATAKLEGLKSRVAGFGKVFRRRFATREAGEAFKRGRKYFSQKKYVEAILLFKAGLALDPDLPGNLRELGESYAALGRQEEALEFYRRYLNTRPFGKNADKIRPNLEKVGKIGKLTVETSFPCDETWVEGQLVPPKLKLKEYPFAPGEYTFLCWSQEYQLVYYSDPVRVEAGKPATVRFDWAIVENKLEPWGRIIVENPFNRGELYDLGPIPAKGVPVPLDRRALRVIVKAGDGSKSKELLLKLEPGQRVPITW